MAGCCGNNNPDNTVWEVTFPDGTKQDFVGEQNALVSITRAGGGSKRKKS
jgi:hypothetical protein